MELTGEDLRNTSDEPSQPSHVYQYNKTGSRADMAGELYEVKMALLLFLRGINQTAGFYLASNVDGAGAFDDIVFKFKLLDACTRFKTCFIQLKHKQRKSVSQEAEKKKTKPLTIEGLYSNSGDFSLGKYHESYREVFKQMKKLANSQDILFSSSFEDAWFVIYTNAPAENNLVKHEKTKEYSSPDRTILSTGGDKEFIFHFHDEDAINYKPNKQQSCEVDNTKKEFLDYLKIYCGQASETELNALIEAEVEYALHTPSSVNKVICKELTSKLSDWWRDSSDVLTESSYIWQEIIIARMKDINIVINNSTHSIGVYYSTQEVDSFHLSVSGCKTVVVTTLDTRLTTLKVLQTLDSYYSKHFMFVSVQSFRDRKAQVLRLWQNPWCHVLAIECSASSTEQELVALLDECKTASPEKLLVLVLTMDGRPNFVPIHFTHVQDSFSFKHLDDKSQEKVKDKKIAFQGIEVFLGDVIKDNIEEVSGYVLHKLLSGHRLTIGCKLPDPIPYYIPRRLERLDCLRNDFKLNNYHSECFVISNIEKEIQAILPYGKNLVKYMPSVTELSSQIMLKDSYFLDKDFRVICDQYPKKSLHWLRFDKGLLKWKQSSSNISLIQQNLANDKRSVYSASHSLLDDRIVLVTAEPGMGKSTLITHLAKEIQTEEPSLWIVRINLNDTTDLLENIDENYFSDINNTVEFLLSATILYEKTVDPQEDFEIKLFKSQFKTFENVAILLDGFDEICPDFPKEVVALLNCLLKTKVRKLWVTSRKSMRVTLQDAMSRVSYTLHPFTREDQHNFLIRYWNSVMNIDSTEKLTAFADLLLELTSKSLNDTEREFTGIPLQTFMLAEVFEKELISFISDGKNCLPARINLLELYERFIEKKQWVFFKEKAKYSTSKPASKREIEKLNKLSQTNHMNAALVLIVSPEQLSTLDSFVPEDAEEFLEEISNVDEKRGIIDGVLNNKPHFIHRTFAEYFVALWLSQHLKSTSTFVKKNLFSENYQIIRYFLDCILSKGCQFHNAILSDSKESIESFLLQENFDINMVDKGNRTALHLAASYSEANQTQDSKLELLLSGGAAIDAVDTVLRWTPLRYADATKSWGHIDKLLGKGGNREDLVLTKQNIADGEMLSEAAKHGYVNLLEFVFDCDVDVDVIAKPQDNWTLLHVAADAGNVRSIDLLLKKGANFESWDLGSKSPLHMAAFKGHLAAVESLVSAGANVKSTDSEQATALHWAASHGHAKVVEYLVERGAIVTARTEEYVTPLQLAAGNGHLDIIRFLESRGGDIKSCDQYNTTPLQEAAERGHLEVIKYLVQNGGNIQTCDTAGKTPLHWASRNGHLPVVEFFVTHGVKVMSETTGVTQPVHWAAEMGHVTVVEFLIKNGCDIDCRDESEATSLLLGSGSGHYEVVEFLISAGADITLRKDGGRGALHLAAEKSCFSVVDFLVVSGADVMSRDNRGSTPLHLAAQYGHLLIVQYLVEKGTVLDVTDAENRTPVQVATDNEQWDTVQWLIATTNANIVGGSPTTS